MEKQKSIQIVSKQVPSLNNSIQNYSQNLIN